MFDLNCEIIFKLPGARLTKVTWVSHIHHQWPLRLAGYQNDFDKFWFLRLSWFCCQFAGKEISSVNPNKQNGWWAREIFEICVGESKEINGGIHHESGGDDCENLLNELLLHVNLLSKTVQFLYEIGNISSLDNQNMIKWKDLENVYSEVEKEFVCLKTQKFCVKKK